MSQYKIDFDRRVKKDLRSINPQELKRIKIAISQLADEPRPSGCKKLKGKSKDYFRIRVGNYRIIYTIEDYNLVILIICVGHRKEVYDKF